MKIGLSKILPLRSNYLLIQIALLFMIFSNDRTHSSERGTGRVPDSYCG